MFGMVVTSTLEERQGWLAEVREAVRRFLLPLRQHSPVVLWYNGFRGNLDKLIGVLTDS
jgi:hypothetical protein